MDVISSSIEMTLDQRQSHFLAFDIEMANSFRHKPPVIALIGLAQYDPEKQSITCRMGQITRADEERTLVEWFLKELNQFVKQDPSHGLLSFAGVDNDVPWIKKRLQIYQIASPESAVFENCAHLDLKRDFARVTQHDRISLLKLEQIFGIDRENTLNARKVSEWLTAICSRPATQEALTPKQADQLERIQAYLTQDVCHLLFIHHRWKQQLLKDQRLGEMEYITRLLSLRNAVKKQKAVPQSIQPLLTHYKHALHTGIQQAVKARTLQGFVLPELPLVSDERVRDWPRVLKKHHSLLAINLKDSAGNLNLNPQLNTPLGVLSVVRKQGNILMIRRAEHLKRAPGMWGLPGGVLEKGECALKGACRELYEELGIKGEAIEFIGITPSFSGHFSLLWVEVEVSKNAQLYPDAREVAEARWVSPIELQQLSPLIPDSLLHFRTLLGEPWGIKQSKTNKTSG